MGQQGEGVVSGMIMLSCLFVCLCVVCYVQHDAAVSAEQDLVAKAQEKVHEEASQLKQVGNTLATHQ